MAVKPGKPKNIGISMLGKLMGLASIGSSLINTALLQRFLEGIIGIIALTIISAMIAGMLLLSGFYGIYIGLTAYGLQPGAALLVIMGAALATGALLVGLTLGRMRRLRELPYHTLYTPIPPLARAGTIAQAFLQGFAKRPTGARF